MKKIVVCLLVFSLFAFAMPARAIETNTYSGTASGGKHFLVAFTTNRVGDVTVNAQWQPKPGASYVLRVKHLLDPNDIYSYDMACDVYTSQPSAPAPGNWTCSVPSGSVGYWTAEFWQVSGKVDVTMTVSAETD